MEGCGGALQQSSAGWSQQALDMTENCARPAVTTGAALPWRAKASRTLGNPRAIQPYPVSVPTITLSKPAADDATAALRPKSNGQTSACPSPFAGQQATPTGSTEVEEVRVRPGVELVKQAGYQEALKQASIHSCDSENSSDRHLAFLPGPQTITTSQDLQGSNSRLPPTQYLGGSATCHINNAPQPRLSISQSTAITTGHRQPVQTPPEGKDDGGPDAPRKEGLRTHLKRKTSDPGEEGSPSKAGQPGETLDAQTDGDRQLQRRRANQDCARRLKDRRNLQLKDVDSRVGHLEVEQRRWRERCRGVDATCRQLQDHLRDVRRRCDAAALEQKRLDSELQYLRHNIRLSLTVVRGCKVESSEPSQDARLRAALASEPGSAACPSIFEDQDFMPCGPAAASPGWPHL